VKLVLDILTAAMAAAVEALGLSKTYTGFFGGRPQRALDRLELRVEPGQAFGLIGPNGAGKTTFIKVMLAIARPTAGAVRVLGGDPESVAVRARIGYLPERLELPGASTPIGCLTSVARMKGLAPDGAALRGLLERVGLGEAAARRIREFSKGMKQRLGLAAALLGRPELLVLDEPTDGVDPLGRVAIRNILAEELGRGATLFLNSHLLSETERLCTRVGILSGGRIVREGPIEELCRVEGRWRARFAAPAPATALEAAGLRAAGDEWIFDGADPALLNGALERARAGGALLVGLRPDERDLEDVLAETLRAS
jgi:ABC-2 type transport system ATP-binding protein